MPAVNNVLVARKSWVNANGQVTQAHVDSIVEGIARAKADKPLSIALINKYLQDRAGSEEQASAAYDYDIDEVLRLPPVVKPEQFRDAMAQLQAADPSKISDFDISSVIDDSFVETPRCGHWNDELALCRTSPLVYTEDRLMPTRLLVFSDFI